MISRLITISVLGFCQLFLVECQSSLLPERLQWMEKEGPKDALLTRSLQSEATGKLYSKCGRSNPCNEGLDCVLSPRGRLCYPMACLRDAAEYTYVEQHMENFADHILEKLGLKDNNTDTGFFNQSTLNALENDEMTERQALEFLINGGVTEQIQAAIQEDPTVVNTFQAHAQVCFPQDELANLNDGDSTGLPATFYMGLHIESSLGFKFAYQALGAALPNGTIPSDACSYHLCFGLGIDVDFHAASLLGVITSFNYEDLKEGSIMMDADLAMGLHFGGAFGFTVPQGIIKAEFTGGFGPHSGIGFGFGGGAGASYCLATVF